ncbi:hypothetical protein D3C87_1325850 [compost metagenome]
MPCPATCAVAARTGASTKRSSARPPRRRRRDDEFADQSRAACLSQANRDRDWRSGDCVLPAFGPGCDGPESPGTGRRIRTQRLGADPARRHGETGGAQARLRHRHAHGSGCLRGRGTGRQPDDRAGDLARRSVFRNLHSSDLESLLHGRQHQCVAGVRPPAHGWRHGPGVADHSGGQAVESQPRQLQHRRRPRGSSGEQTQPGLRRTGGRCRTLAGTGQGHAQGSGAVPVHRQAAT